MAEQNPSMLFQLKLSADQIIQALIEVLPPLIVPIIVAACAAIWARHTSKALLSDMTDGQGAPAVVLETLFFGLVGVALAYLSYMTNNGLIAQITSNLVAGFAILLQLLGLSTEKVSPPFSRMNILWAATSGALSFIVSARYYAIAFGTSASTGG